jgi:hypothetical protein
VLALACAAALAAPSYGEYRLLETAGQHGVWKPLARRATRKGGGCVARAHRMHLRCVPHAAIAFACGRSMSFQLAHASAHIRRAPRPCLLSLLLAPPIPCPAATWTPSSCWTNFGWASLPASPTTHTGMHARRWCPHLAPRPAWPFSCCCAAFLRLNCMLLPLSRTPC